MTKSTVFAIVLTCGLLSLPSEAAQRPAPELADAVVGATPVAHATVGSDTGETAGMPQPAGTGLRRLLRANGGSAAKVSQLTASLYAAWWENLVDDDGDGNVSRGDLMWDADVTGGSGSLYVEYDVFRRRAGASDWVILGTVGPHTITDDSPDDSYGMTINGDGPPAQYEYAIGVAQVGASHYDDMRYPSEDGDLGPVGVEGAEYDGGGGADASSLWVAVGASTPGVGGTFWRTDLGVLNRGNGVVNVTITVHTSAGPVSATDQIADGGQVIYHDLLGQLGETKGSIQVTSDRRISVTSRTYNDRGAAGTDGQFLDGLELSQGASAGESFVLMHLVADGGWRTNLGFQNMGASQAQLSVTYFGSDGYQIGGPVLVSIAPSQVDDSTARFPAGNAGYAVVRVTAGTGVQAYASVIDPITGDATTIPMKF
jgi:hypothetical protein